VVRGARRRDAVHTDVDTSRRTVFHDLVGCPTGKRSPATDTTWRHRRSAALRMVRSARRVEDAQMLHRREVDMKLNREVLAEMKVKPGESAGSTRAAPSTWRRTGWVPRTRTGTAKSVRRSPKRTSESRRRTRAAQELSGERHVLALDRAPGDGRGRQRRDDQARHVGCQSPRLSVEAFKQPSAEELATISCGDARRRCPSSAPSASSTAPTTRTSGDPGAPELLAKTHEMRVMGHEKF